MSEDPGLIFVLLIGTNNLGRGHSDEQVAAGVMANVRLWGPLVS